MAIRSGRWTSRPPSAAWPAHWQNPGRGCAAGRRVPAVAEPHNNPARRAGSRRRHRLRPAGILGPRVTLTKWWIRLSMSVQHVPALGDDIAVIVGHASAPRAWRRGLGDDAAGSGASPPCAPGSGRSSRPSVAVGTSKSNGHSRSRETPCADPRPGRRPAGWGRSRPSPWPPPASGARPPGSGPGRWDFW